MTPQLSVEETKRLRRLATPLGLVFWGALVVAIQPALAIRIGDAAATTQPLTVALGLALMTTGVLVLAFGNYFTGAADLVASGVAALYGFMLALFVASWFIPRLRQLDPRGELALSALRMVGFVALCWCLYRLTTDLSLPRHARSWAVTGSLALVLSPLPQAFLVFAPELTSRIAFWLFAGIASLIPTIAFLLSAYRLRSLALEVAPHVARRFTI